MTMRRANDNEFPIMRLKNGKAPLIVTQVGYSKSLVEKKEIKVICYKYLSEANSDYDGERGPRQLCDFVKYEGPMTAPPVQELTINMNGITAKETVAHIMNKMKPGYNFLTGEYEPKEYEVTDLYQTKEDVPRFGNPLLDGTGKPMKNSLGGIILEMRGEGGRIEAFAPDMIELVTPYTVALKCINDTDPVIHVVAKPGQVEKDQVLLEKGSGRLWLVIHVDSKNRSPKEMKNQWLLVPTVAINFGEEDKPVVA